MKPTYQSRSAVVDSGVMLSRVYCEDECLSHRQVHSLWQSDREFRLFYAALLLEPDYAGFCWETPPITQANLDTDHEFAVVQSTNHEHIQQNSKPFAEHFNQPEEIATAFPNLGKNGIMITPYPDASFDGGSIATFLRSASEDRIDALWTVVGREVCQQVNNKPIWISTAGLGVSWLHIRIDSKPKYYRYQPYK